MKTFLRYLTLVAALIVGLNVNAQSTDLTVSDGTTTNYYVPVYGTWTDAYLRSQTIYPADSLTSISGGTIYGLTFYASQTNVAWGNANFQVKLTEVTNTTLSAYEDVTSATTVYTGSLAIVNNQMQIIFTTPYSYGGGNLLVEVDNLVTGSYSSSSWYGTSVTGASYQGYSSSSFDAIWGSARAFMPKATFVMNSICIPVTNLTVSNITTSGATLTWSDGGNTSATYTVYNMADTSVVATGLTDTTYTLSSLTANTEYTYGVVANCSSTSISNYTTITVHTPCDVLSVPYTENFDSVTTSTTAATGVEPNCWTMAHADASWSTASDGPQVYYSSTYAHSGSYSLRLYYRCIYALPEFTPDVDQLQMNFWVRQAIANYQLVVGVMSDLSDETTFVPVDTINCTSTTAYEEHTVYFDQYTGADGYIAFRNINTGTSSYGINYIDDVTVDYLPTCFPVADLAVSGLASDGATLNWADNSNTSATYTVYNMADTSVVASNVTGTSYTLTGLTENTDYSYGVMVNCSDGNVTTIVSVNFHTPCAALSVPYTENFDSLTTSTTAATGVEPNCWTRAHADAVWSIASYAPQVYYSSTYANSGSYSLRLYYCCIYALPEFTPDVDQLQMNFWVRQTNANYQLVVGVMSDLSDETTFVPVDTINCASTSAYEEHTVYFDQYTGADGYIAFRNIHTGTYSYSTNYIDDVTVDYMPTCFPVTDVTASDVTASGATLTWTDNTNTGATYTVYNMADTSVVATGITDTTYTLTGLQPVTSYTYGVVANCSATDASGISAISFTTPMVGNQVTVYEGTTTNNFVPVYGLYADAYLRSQTVYPADSLTAMVGDTINGLTFYASQANVSWSGNFQVRLWEDTVTTLSAFVDTTNANTVYNGTLAIVDGQMLIAFTTPYVYNGGNLILEVENLSPGNYSSSSWYGTGVTGASWRGYSYTSIADITGSVRNFIPQTTFNYLEVSAPATDLTVYDGTTTNNYVPVYGFYVDYYLRSQTIYPADSLTAISGGTIYGLTFYASQASANWGSPNFQVKLTEVANTTLTGFETITDATTVYTGVLSIDDHQMQVIFTTPYTYNGGNLLIEVENLNPSTYASCSWYGQTVSGASWQGYNGTSIDNITGSVKNFIPKTTFGMSPICIPVSDLTASNLSTTGVTLSWSDAGNAGATYTVYNMADTSVVDSDLTDTTYTLSNLTANTEYTYGVVASCSATSISRFMTITVNTPCEALSVPYTETFDSITTSTTSATGVEPNCWTMAHADATWSTASYGPQIYYNSSYAHSGSYSLRLYYRCIYALPAFDTNVNQLQLNFWVRQSGTSYQLVVGVMSNLSDETTFVPVDTIICSSTSASEEHTVYFNQYTGADGHIAFRNINTGTSSTSANYIDDVTVDYMPTCFPVTDVTASDVTASGATLTWTDNTNTGATYTIYNMADTSVVATGVSATTYALTGLTGMTPYTFGVEVNCSATDISSIQTVSFTTLAEPLMCGTELATIVANADSATTTTNYFPGYSLFNYSYTEVIIPAERLGNLSEIKGMEFKPTTVAAGSSRFNNCEIYMMHTTATSLGTAFIQDTDNLQLVYTGDLNYDNTNWRQVEFDNSFMWNGTDNVLIAIRRNDGTWASSGSFAAFTSTDTLARYIYEDGSAYTIGEITGGTAYTTIPLYHLIGCPSPETISIVFANSDSTKGSITPVAGTYEYNGGDTVVATAAANTGYSFACWTVSAGDITTSTTDNPFTYVLSEFLIGQTITVTANWSVNDYTLTVVSNDTTLGTVTGGGVYAYGTTATIEATPATNCHFVSWNDGNTEATRSVVVDGDATYTATFAYDSVTVVLAVNDDEMGSINPEAGTYTYAVGETFTAEATANEGYELIGWSYNGAEATDMTDASVSQTFTADFAGQTVTYTAMFQVAPVRYNVTLTVRDAEGNANVGGTVTGDGTYAENEDVTITATPADGYTFVNWTDAEGTVISTEATYTFAMPAADVAYIAVFAAETQGIDDANMDNIVIYSVNDRVVVRGAENQTIRVFDVVGRLVAQRSDATDEESFQLTNTGVYMVQVGNAPARRVVVRK